MEFSVSHLGKQWAAVSTKSGEIKTPPQIWEPLKWSDNCQGHWPNFASVPPMIRDVDCCRPQSRNGSQCENDVQKQLAHTQSGTHTHRLMGKCFFISWYIPRDIKKYINGIFSIKVCWVIKLYLDSMNQEENQEENNQQKQVIIND